jgi:hypothetical protein
MCLLAALWVVTLNAAQGQEIWLSPNTPDPKGRTRGVEDLLDMFRPDAPWSETGKRVGVFLLSTQFMAAVSDDDLARIVRDLDRRGIKLAIASLALNWVGEATCGQGIEGYGDAAAPMRIVEKLKRAGGALSYVAMDEPLWFGHFYSGPNACRSPVANVVQRVSTILRIYRAAFPDVRLGDVEPIPALTSQPGWQSAYADWRKEFRSAMGVEIAFLHYDVDWNAPGFADAIIEAASFAKKHDMPFGFILNGNDRARTQTEWLRSAREHVGWIEEKLCGSPPAVVFASWVAYPERMLPETSDTTFTGLVRWYIDRTKR